MEISTTIIIILITCLVSIPGFGNQKLIESLVFYPARMKGGKEMHRFLSHGLIHADYMHLFLNMLTLFYFGPVAEYILGTAGYIILYITALIASSLMDFFKQKDNYSYRALGASGAIAAVLFTTIILDPWARSICLFGILCLPNILFGILYIVYSNYMEKRGMDNIGHNAHMWGGVYGFVFAALYRPDLLQNFIAELTHPRW